MKSLAENIMNINNKRYALLYGNINDLICTPDMILRTVNEYLLEVLTEICGFERVVYFDQTNVSGETVYTKADASSAPSSAVMNPDQGQGVRFGKPRVPAPGYAVQIPEINQNAADTAASPGSAPQPALGGKFNVQYYPNMSEEFFFDRFKSYLKDESVPTAVVFLNFPDMLRNSVLMRRYSEILHHHLESERDTANRNSIIFIHPDMNSNHDRTFAQLLSSSNLLEKFMCRVSDEYILNDRCFSVSSPGIDEISNLLLRYNTIGDDAGHHLIPFGMTVTRAACILVRLMMQNNEQMISIRDLDKRIRDILGDEGHTFINYKFIAGIVGISDSDLPNESPLDTLKKTAGWENAYDVLSKTAGKFNSRITPPAYSHKLFTERFFGSRSNVSHFELPNFAVSGNPGCGKTEIARLISTVFFDAGILARGHFIEASASKNIIATYVGGTGENIRRLFDRAEGGVLIIDDCQTLYTDADSGRNGSFHQEAVATIADCMNDSKRKVIVVFTGNSKGYGRNSVEDFLSMDARLTVNLQTITVDDTPHQVLAQIFRERADRAGFSIDSSLNLNRFFERLYIRRDTTEYSNVKGLAAYTDRILAEAIKCRDENIIVAEDFPENERIYFENEITADMITKEFDLYPGMGAIGKSIIEDELIKFRSHQKRFPHIAYMPRHIVFCGNSGVGKSTLAELLHKAFAAAGILSSAPMVKLDGSTATPESIRKAIDAASAHHTVLFVDEGHSLDSLTLSGMMEQMQSNRNLLMFFAMYKSKYEEVTAKEAGFFSRCNVVEIEDYLPEDLFKISCKMAEANKYTLDPSMEKPLMLLYNNWYACRDTMKNKYGNARDVQSLFERIQKNCDKRTEEYGGKSFHIIPVDIPEKEREIIRIASQNANLDDILKECDRYIAFESVRSKISELHKNLTYEKIFEKKETSEICLANMRLLGPSGTGKTTAGKILANAFYALGITKRPDFLSLKANELVASYVGQTTPRTMEMLSAGKNATILIDEIYTLAYSEDGDKGDSFKKEAVETIMAFQDENPETVLLIAGYPDEMDRFVKNVNRGFMSRFPCCLDFRPFTPEELLKIFKMNLKNHHLLPESEKIALLHLESMSHIENFGNGRYAAGFAEEVLFKHKTRIIDHMDQYSPDDDRYLNITEEDVSAAIASKSLY